MAALVTTDEVRRHLKLTATDMADADLAADVATKAEGATEIVIDYIKRPDHEWDSSDAPALVKAAILLVAEDLFNGGGGLIDPVKNILHRYRDPALA